MIEHRSFAVDLRAAAGAERVIEGYAAVFNSPVRIGNWFTEQVAPGAFAESLRGTEHDIFGYWNHDSNIVLASRDSKTLTVSEDDKGLRFSMVVDDDALSDHAYRAVKSGKVSKASFGFAVLTDEWSMKDGEELRTLKKVELYEVSPVSLPAYGGTSAEARSAEKAWEQHLAVRGTSAIGKAERVASLDVLYAINESRNRKLKGVR